MAKNGRQETLWVHYGRNKNQTKMKFEIKIRRRVAILRKSDAFGELALETRKPRAATIRARMNSTLAILSASDYTKIFGSAVKKEMNQKRQFLKRIFIFSKLSR